MRKIKICLSTTDLLLSKLIRFFQGSEFSHSFVEWNNAWYDSELIYEAKGLSSYIINKKYLSGNTIYEFEADVTDEKYYEIMKYIHGDVGVEYAWKEMIGYAVKRIFSIVGIKIKNPFPQKGRVCSESCGDIAVRFFGVSPDIGYDDMDLNWLFEKLKDHPDFKMIKGK